MAHVVKHCDKCKKEFSVFPCRKETARFCSRACLATVRSTKHGGSKERTYNIWRSMKNRCDSKNNTNYHRYGGRGISYDKKWKSYQGFVEDMGIAPDGRELDRIDNDGNYCKENCRWTSRTKQNRNRGLNKNNRTGVAGVHHHQDGYKVRIKADYKSHYIGVTKSLEEAKIMRKEAEAKYWK